jgi:glycosyltransferase involved in cell wall biosynthesis
MILYIGNFLEEHGRNPNFNKFLIAKFQQHFDVEFASGKANRLLRLLDMLMMVWRSRKKAHVAVIDVFSTDAFWFAYCTARLCRWIGLPYIAILRGGNLLQRLNSSPGTCRAVFNYSAANVSPSVYLRDGFLQAGYRAVHIPNFIELKDYPFKEREVCRPRLLWVRSFHRIYNPTLAVDILEQLRRTHADAVLCMVGPDKDGSLAQVRQRADELGVAEALTVTGRLARQEWICLARDYDIFINTTDFDNHPVSVIEAMSLGLPLVSTNVGGMPYLIEHGKDGILVPPRDVTAFMEAIEDLLQNPARASRLAGEARRKVQGFDWSVLKGDWLRLLAAAMRPVA